MIKKYKAARHRRRVRHLAGLLWVNSPAHIVAWEVTRDGPFVGRLREAWDLKVAMQKVNTDVVDLDTYHGSAWRAYGTHAHIVPFRIIVSMVRYLPEIGPDAYQTIHISVWGQDYDKVMERAFMRTLQSYPNKETTT